MSGTNPEHDMGSFMNQCKQLCNRSITTIYKNIWGDIVDKSKSPTFTYP